MALLNSCSTIDAMWLDTLGRKQLAVVDGMAAAAEVFPRLCRASAGFWCMYNYRHYHQTCTGYEQKTFLKVIMFAT